MIHQLRRREFVTLLSRAAAMSSTIWPLATRAQQRALPVIGYLTGGSSAASNYIKNLAAFRQGLGSIGYVEGQNVAIEYRNADSQNDRLPALAADLLRRQVALIYAGDNAAAVAAKAANTTIPIVFRIGGDPISLGLVASLNRPGGNMTGVSFLSTTTVAIRLQMLHEAVPKATVIGALVNPANPNAEPDTREAQEAARKLGLELHALHASSDQDIDAAFATLVQRRTGALFIDGDPFFGARLVQLAILSARHALPAIYATREFPDAGGLMSYGASNFDANRLGGVYAGRVLKGDKPADLPVQQAVKVELIINLKTAKALGLTFPLTLLGRADEVIE
jgi:putative tryptophan/tyrosine transport system substrate-binding protein